MSALLLRSLPTLCMLPVPTPTVELRPVVSGGLTGSMIYGKLQRAARDNRTIEHAPSRPHDHLASG